MISTCILSCKTEDRTGFIEQWKSEIRDTERAFANLAKDKGLKAAFVTFAADDAVLNRRNKLIKGKQAIAEYFDNPTLKDVRLQWEPEFISVSASGDLGYTYGPYTFEASDDSGKVIEDRGIFHTVWRREPDGRWRYVWD